MSMKFTPAASMRTSACPLAGLGVGSSTSFITSGPPGLSIRIARMGAFTPRRGRSVKGVDHESRIHLDIEADDLEAEVNRLEALGAKRIGFLKRWWVMEAPTGQRFCVVNPQRGPLQGRANEWADSD